MRVGILTLPLHTNYGGILQAYALQAVLERMGHEVVVFNTPSQKLRLTISSILFNCKKLPIIGSHISSFMNKHQGMGREVISRNIQKFIRKYINLKEIHSFQELNANDYDALIVGSDQVWRAIYFSRWQQSIENAFLSFAKDWNVDRVAYAASFGIDNWEYTDEQTKNCKDLIKKFAAISVREKSGVDLCKKKFGIDALHVLDPTMLLDVNAYKHLFEIANVSKSSGTFLNYVLDETDEIKQLIENITIKRGLKPFAVNNPFENDDSKPLQMRIKVSVETWLRGFYDAEFVITDSFHACVFSILFKKQFVVVGNRKRGMSRFISLLEMFGLENRMIDSNTDIDNLQDIDYSEVYAKYDELKCHSMNFLIHNLQQG